MVRCNEDKAVCYNNYRATLNQHGGGSINYEELQNSLAEPQTISQTTETWTFSAPGRQ